MTFGLVGCRSCGEPSLVKVLSLGDMPLANGLLDARDLGSREDRYPLELVFCPSCSLVQILETVPPAKLFGEYIYFSSYSDTMVDHARRLVEELVETRGLGQESLVVELASNDGYLLQFYRKKGIPVLGVEPAKNIARVARDERGIPTIVDYFGIALAGRLIAEGKRANVVHAHNVLAHVADLAGFVTGMQMILADDGIAVIEVPYVRDLVEGCEFDTIYHEHLCYFSITALSTLFSRHGLSIQEVKRLPIHGGSLRLYVSHARRVGPSVSRALEEERQWGLDRLEYFHEFGDRAERLRDEILSTLKTVKSRGHHIAGYGAAAKGTILLNYVGVDKTIIDFVVDRNPHKQGRYVPGVRLPIYAPERLLSEMPAYLLILAWNFADEIIHQQAEYQARGGHFIVPIPRVESFP